MLVPILLIETVSYRFIYETIWVGNGGDLRYDLYMKTSIFACLLFALMVHCKDSSLKVSEAAQLEINTKYERLEELTCYKGLLVKCRDCDIPRTLRNEHCLYCNSCVTKMECHSFVQNTCIGSRNILFYVLFMISFTAYHILCLIQVRQYAHENKFEKRGEKSVAYLFYGWAILFSGKEILWPTVSVRIYFF